MRDISHKISTLRTAKATAKVYCTHNTIEKINRGHIPKGNIFEFARAAGYMAAKKTDQLLPHCHPVTIDGMEIFFTVAHSDIEITVEAKSIGRTGIEMEALTAASVAALTIYDMLKPVDAQLSIGDIKLIDKKGGKSERKYFNTPPSCAILVCVDSKKSDEAGPLAKEMLMEQGIEQIEYEAVSEDKTEIQTALQNLLNKKIDFIFTVGGTGLSKSDNMFDAVKNTVDYELEGVVAAMYGHGQARTALAMVSRLISGVVENSVVTTLPGSKDGLVQCLQAILPAIFQTKKMLRKN